MATDPQLENFESRWSLESSDSSGMMGAFGVGRGLDLPGVFVVDWRYEVGASKG